MKILVIEDDPSLNRLLCLHLGVAGYSVSSASGGAEGLRLASESEFDLVLLDVMMPDVDGWQVCERLRQVSDVPIIMLTAKVQQADIIRGLQLGADDYIKKPFNMRELDLRIEECDARISTHAKASEAAQRIQKLSGVGALTASAVVATIPHAKDFCNGRQLSAWSGLVPRQQSSGGKSRLGKITKRGDSYLRGLMTQGARSTLQSALKKQAHQRSRLQHWIVALHGRVGYHKTLVAIANKHLRIIWAILAKGEDYDPNAWQRYQQARAMH